MMPDDNSGESLRDKALELYDKFGWNVFPINRFTKRPYWEWEELQKKRPPRDKVRGWREWDNKNAGVAVVTGEISDVVVVDADNDEAVEFLTRKGHPACPMVRSGRQDADGLHLYFKHPGFKVGPGAGICGVRKLDIRGDGGYAVVPPTVHESGKGYEWLISPEDATPPNAPLWLTTALAERNVGDKEKLDWNNLWDTSIPNGRRDPDLVARAGWFYWAQMPLDMIFIYLKNLNNSLKAGPIKESQLWDKIKQAKKNWTPGDPDSLREIQIRIQSEQPPPLQIFSHAELMDTEFEETKWAVPGILPEGTMLLGGRPKVGKSLLVLDVCMGIAEGSQVLGSIEIEEPSSVLYMALEDHRKRLHKRSRQLRPHARLPKLDFVDFAGKVDTGLIYQIEWWLQAHPDAKLVVVDTFAKIKSRSSAGSSKNANMYDEDYQNMEALTQLAGSHNVAILIITHLNQSRDISDPLEMITGSSGLTGAADGTMVLLRGREEAHAYLKAFHRDLDEDLDIAITRQPDGSWHYAGDAESFRISREEREIMQILSDAEGLLSPREVHERLENPQDQKVNNVNRSMLKMVDKAILVKDHYGKYRVSAAAPVLPAKPPTISLARQEEEKEEQTVEVKWF